MDVLPAEAAVITAGGQQVWISLVKVVDGPARAELADELRPRISNEVSIAAADAVHDLLVESRTSPKLFFTIINFIFQTTMISVKNTDMQFFDDVFDAFTESTVRLTKRLIAELEMLVEAGLREEEYQQFLKENPVLLNPLATSVVSKQKLGTEYATDFAVQRLDSEWILVEIEKPGDRIFTQRDDFRMEFTHGFGQVIDFIEWVADQKVYAQKLMPGIEEPRGLLVIGRAHQMTDRQLKKLARLKKTLSRIQILTYDDLIHNAKTYYENLRKIRVK